MATDANFYALDIRSSERLYDRGYPIVTALATSFSKSHFTKVHIDIVGDDDDVCWSDFEK